MFPIRDDTPRFSTPYVTYFLVAFNFLIFFFEWSLTPESLDLLIRQFGFIPAQVTAALNGSGRITLGEALLPVLTAMFLHGSWMHVIGNMWFLWIFGDNIEDYLGHFPFLLFYLLCGVAATFLQYILAPASRVPNVGASGAIAGVLGGYFILYPRARVLTWFPIFFMFYLPAWVMLGYWFVYQFLSGAATSITYSSDVNRGGVAFWAHVGGFVAGMALIKVFPARQRRNRYGTW